MSNKAPDDNDLSKEQGAAFDRRRQRAHRRPGATATESGTASNCHMAATRSLVKPDGSNHSKRSCGRLTAARIWPGRAILGA